MFGVEAGHAFAAFRIFDEPLTVVGNPTGIELVVEYAVPPEAVSIDR